MTLESYLETKGYKWDEARTIARTIKTIKRFADMPQYRDLTRGYGWKLEGILDMAEYHKYYKTLVAFAIKYEYR